MTTRRRFTAEFKARVALEALRGDKTVQEIAARHQVHPNQVSTWKRQAMDGLSAGFSNGTDHERQDREELAQGSRPQGRTVNGDGDDQRHLAPSPGPSPGDRREATIQGQERRVQPARQDDVFRVVRLGPTEVLCQIQGVTHELT